MSHSYWTATPEWYGETAYILGCGPSLNIDDVSLLQGRRVIAINDAYRLAPWAEVLYFCDQKWWDEHKMDVLDRFVGRMIVTMSNLIHGVKTLRCTGDTGLETDPGAVRHGSNSGFQCINLAYHLGATRIVLLGYDMRVNGHKLHWCHRRDMQTADGFQRTLSNVMLPKFQSIVQPLAEAGVEVINCTPRSALTLWPIRDICEVL